MSGQLTQVQTMAQATAAGMRRTQNIVRQVPVRVRCYDQDRGEFCEDTNTTLIRPGGAQIILTHWVVPGDYLRLTNLEEKREADFRIVGANASEHAGRFRVGLGVCGIRQQHLGKRASLSRPAGRATGDRRTHLPGLREFAGVARNSRRKRSS